MPPKAKKAGASKGKQKSVKEPDRPSWWSEEAWKASKDVPKLVEKLRGVAEKGPQGVSRAQASFNISEFSDATGSWPWSLLGCFLIWRHLQNMTFHASRA